MATTTKQTEQTSKQEQTNNTNRTNNTNKTIKTNATHEATTKRTAFRVGGFAAPDLQGDVRGSNATQLEPSIAIDALRCSNVFYSSFSNSPSFVLCCFILLLAALHICCCTSMFKVFGSLHKKRDIKNNAPKARNQKTQKDNNKQQQRTPAKTYVLRAHLKTIFCYRRCFFCLIQTC